MKKAIEYAGQPYVDDKVYVNPKPLSEIERACAHLFGRDLPGPIHCGGYERVRLRWVKPDGSPAQ